MFGHYSAEQTELYRAAANRVTAVTAGVMLALHAGFSWYSLTRMAQPADAAAVPLAQQQASSRPAAKEVAAAATAAADEKETTEVQGSKLPAAVENTAPRPLRRTTRLSGGTKH